MKYTFSNQNTAKDKSKLLCKYTWFMPFSFCFSVICHFIVTSKLHSPPPAHRGLTLWLPVHSRDDRCELLWRHPRPDRTHPQNQHQQRPASRHSDVHHRWDKVLPRSITVQTNLKVAQVQFILFLTQCLNCKSLTRCFGWMVGRPPGDAQQCLALGASGSGEPRPLCFFCLYA